MIASENKKIIIIGGGLGGLSAGIHLRLAGFEVDLYEAGARVGGRANVIERDGFRFDTGPSLLNYPWVFEELFASAGRRLSDYVELLKVDPSITFRWSNGETFKLSSDASLFLSECERFEPGASASVFAFFRDAEKKYRIAFDRLISRNVDNPLRWLGSLSPMQLWQTSMHRSLAGELRRYFKNPRIREALGSYAMYLGGSPFSLPGMFTILAYGELAYGLWLPKSGIYGLIEAISRLALELGVNIQTNCPIKRITINNHCVTGVELENGEFHAASLVVSNVDVPTTDTQLIDERFSGVNQLRRRALKTKMTPGVVTFYWGVRGEIENLGHHTIFLTDDYRGSFDDLLNRGRLPREVPFYTSVPSATDPTLAPPEGSCLFVLVPTPVLSQMNGSDLNSLVPRIKSHILETFSRHNINFSAENIAFEEIWTPADWHSRFGLYDGSAFGAAHTLSQIGPFRSRNYSSQIKGLYYVGAGTTPGTGMPMVTLGGRLVAERILSHVH